jgi:hypothetical protein
LKRKKSEFLSGFGKAYELLKAIIDALLEQGGGDDDLTRVITNKDLASQIAKLILDGKAEIAMRKHVIDCDADPFVPENWKVEEHLKGGQFEWNPEKVALYLSEGQKTGSVVGHELRKELAGKPVMNACVLDFLLAHPHLIPEEWKVKAIFFWGTVYRDSDGYLYVRYLYWDGAEWDWHSDWLVSLWFDNNPAVLSAASFLISLSALGRESFVSEAARATHRAFFRLHPIAQRDECIFYYPKILSPRESSVVI